VYDPDRSAVHPDGESIGSRSMPPADCAFA
jgi:hypothetical protein